MSAFVLDGQEYNHAMTQPATSPPIDTGASGRSPHTFTWILELSSVSDVPGELTDTAREVARQHLGPGPAQWVASEAAGVANLIVRTDPSLASLGRTVHETTELLFLDTILRLVDPNLGRLTRPLVLQLAQGAMNEGATLAAVLRALNLGQAGITEALLHECERLIPVGEQGANMRALVSSVVDTHNQLADVITDMHPATENPVLDA